MCTERHYKKLGSTGCLESISDFIISLSKLQLVLLENKERDFKNTLFHFKLPEGLVLCSASIDDMLELHFESSPIRKRMLLQLFTLPMRISDLSFFTRLFQVLILYTKVMHCCPSWMRGTKVGNLLADTDGNMKCLHVGARSNEEKNSF